MNKRIIIKISGEALADTRGFGLDEEVLGLVCDEIKEAVLDGFEVGIVVGGGNFWRGRQSVDMNRTTADHMGMLATVINALALTSKLNSRGIKAKAMSMVEAGSIAENYSLSKALKYFENGYVIVFGGGTGSPFFTTDTAASLKAAELSAGILLLGKNVDGVYDSDPKINKNAKKFSSLAYMDVIEKNLKVMDLTAVSMCMDNNIEIRVFSIKERGCVKKALNNINYGTTIR